LQSVSNRKNQQWHFSHLSGEDIHYGDHGGGEYPEEASELERSGVA